VKTLDEAFESRVHLSIDYPELSQESRRKIWKNFLDRMQGDFKVSDQDLTAISQVDVNGREIKNVMKLADLLANSEKIPLEASHIKTILKVQQENSKIKKSKGLKDL
jgi:AAA+ superfamily predicted ATPase